MSRKLYPENMLASSAPAFVKCISEVIIGMGFWPLFTRAPTDISVMETWILQEGRPQSIVKAAKVYHVTSGSGTASP